MNPEKEHSPDGVSDEKHEVKLNDDLREETLHDSALRGHLATDKCVFVY